MKTLQLLIMAMLCLNLTANQLFSQANVQVVHNSSDPVAGTVDIYVNGQKPNELDDFEYRDATPYLPVPSGTSVTITVAASSSSNVTDEVIANFDLGSLNDGEDYIVVANGIAINSSSYTNPDPMNRDISFDLEVTNGGITSNNSGKVDLKVLHGVTDAPAVDIYLRNVSQGEEYPENPQVAGLDYLDATPFVELEPDLYNLKITAAGDPNLVVGEYNALLNPAAGSKVFVNASGFLTTNDEDPSVSDAQSFGLNAIFPTGNTLMLPSAEFTKVQIIHNAADTLAETVDVYLNGLKPNELDDFDFRDATPYLDVPAGLPITVTVAGASSQDVSDQVVGTFDLPALDKDVEYVVVANGVLGVGYNNSDEDNRDITFDLYPLIGRTEATSDDKVAINVWHGATDASAVDIYTDIDADPLIAGLDYGSTTDWIEVDNLDIDLLLTAEGNKGLRLRDYSAPLSQFGGESLFIFASGFLSPEDEPNAPQDREFGLFVAKTSGEVVELPELNPTAGVQVIHNAADPAAEIVDIYINGEKPSNLDDISFREASPYLPVPANESLTITIAGSNSENVNDAKVADFIFDPLEVNKNYVIVANGVLGDNFNNPNVGSRNISFDLYPVGGSITANDDNSVNIAAWHGATDAPAVDIYANIDEEPLIPGLDYSDFSGWTEVTNNDITLTVTVAGDKSTVAGEFRAPLSQFGGSSLFIFASGFLTPEDEPDMPANRDFGLFVATNSGLIIELEEPVANANVQVIHNAANPIANIVDIYINGDKPEELDDFTFREATPYLDLPANEDINITIALPSSQNANDQVVETYSLGQLEAGNDYIVIANGVNIMPNDSYNTPDQTRDIKLDLFAIEGKKESSEGGLVAINAWHGVTDAPAVDIYTDIDGEALVPGLDYSDFSGWTEVPNTDITLTLTVAGDKSTVAGKFDAPLSLFGGESLFIFASGFLTSDDEQGMPTGRDFGLLVATAEGDVIELSNITSVDFEKNITNLYPNPTNGDFNVESEQDFDMVRIYDLEGNMLFEQKLQFPRKKLKISDIGYNNGQYVVVTYSGIAITSVKMQVYTK